MNLLPKASPLLIATSASLLLSNINTASAQNNSPPPVHFGKLHNFAHPPQALDSRASSGVYNEPRRPRQL